MSAQPHIGQLAIALGTALGLLCYYFQRRGVPLRRLAALATLALLLFPAGLLLQGLYSNPQTVKATSVKPDKERHAAPDFALKDGDGKTVHLSDYKGKVVLLDFWATWCGPCKFEIPWFIDLERRDKDKGFEVLGVSMDDNGWEDVKPFLADFKVNYRVVIGNDETARIYGGVDALPTTFLIDRDGRIAAIHIGLTSRKEIEDGVEDLLRTAPATPVSAVPGAVPAARVAANQ